MNLSIVVPVYNIENYVRPMLDSLLNQSEQRFEIVIVDDGSTDQTYNLVAEFISQYPNLQCKIIRTNNYGVSAARNKGLAESTGTYVLFLDGDDYIADHLVKTIYPYLKKQAPDIICWGYSLVREDKSSIVSFTSPPNETSGITALEHIFVNKSLRIWTGSIAYKRTFLLENEIKYTERCVNGEDQEFIYKTLSRAGKVITLAEVLSFYLQRNASITNSYNVQKFDVVAAFKRVDQYFKAHSYRELETVSDLLLNRELTENYFFNLKTCLYGTEGINIRTLLHDIEQKYPGLNGEIQLIMKRYSGDDKQLSIQIKAFLLSPLLYHRLINMDRSLLYLKRRIKTVITVQKRHA